MNKYLTSFVLALLTVCPLTGFSDTSAVEKDPAYLPIDKVLDLKTIQPEVNINLPRFLLKDALSGINGTNGSAVDGIDIADLIKDVKLIRVVVIEVNQTNRSAVEKAVKTLRSDLEKKWTTIVSVPEEKEHVGVYAMSDPAGESTAGLAILVYDNTEAVIGNIVGRVSIGKLINIASQSNKVPKDLLKKLQGLGNPSSKTDDSTRSNDTAAPETKSQDSNSK